VPDSGLLRSSRQTETEKDIEIIVLRNQVCILERQLNARVAYRPVDRTILAALYRLLPRWRWLLPARPFNRPNSDVKGATSRSAA